MGTAAFDQRIHGFLAPVPKSEHEQIDPNTELLGSPVRSQSRPPIAAGFLISEPPYNHPAADFRRLRSLQPAHHAFDYSSPYSSPASHCRILGGELQLAGGGTSEVESEREPGCKPRTIAGGKVVLRLRATLCARPRRRGQEGSESWPALPLTQCREAGEGRRTHRGCPSSSFLGRETPTRRSAQRRHPLPHAKTAASARQPGPLPTLPAEASCG